MAKRQQDMTQNHPNKPWMEAHSMCIVLGVGCVCVCITYIITLSTACLTYEMKVKHSKYSLLPLAACSNLFGLAFYFLHWPHSNESEFLLSSLEMSWKLENWL